MKKKLILVISLVLLVAVCAVAFVACKDGGDASGTLSVNLQGAEALGAAVSNGKITISEDAVGFTREKLFKALVLSYKDGGSSEEITEGISVNWDGLTDELVAGEYDVKLVYNVGGKTASASFKVVILEKEVPTIVGITAKGGQREFVWNGEFSNEGLSVIVEYSDGVMSTINNGFIVNSEAYNATVTGSYKIIVTYSAEGKAFEDFYYVNVGAAPVIGITAEPALTEFALGDQFSFAGIKVYALLADGNRKEVTEGFSVVSESFKSGEPGKYNVIVRYNNEGTQYSTEYDVKVLPKSPESLRVVGMPTEFAWDEDFSSGGITVYADYKYFPSVDVTKDASIIVGDYNKKVPGTYEIVVNYIENDVVISTKYEVTVGEPKLSKITVSGAKSTFHRGELFESTGLTVIAEKEDGTKSTVESGYSIDSSAYDSMTQTDYYIIVSYTLDGITKVAGYSVSVGAPDLVSLAIVKTPTKATYKINENLDYTGIELTATYTDGTKGAFTATDAARIIASGFNTKTRTLARSTTFSIAGYKEVATTGTFTYSVYDDITGITITKQPTRLVYYKSDKAFDFTGMEYSVKYANSADETGLTYDENVLGTTSFNSTTQGNKSISIIHLASGKAATIYYEVKNRIIAVVGARPKTMYFLGDELDLTGGTIIFTSDFGGYTPVTKTMAELTTVGKSGFDSTQGTPEEGRFITFTFNNYSIFGESFSGTVQVEYHVCVPTAMEIIVTGEDPHVFYSIDDIDYTETLFAGCTFKITYSDGHSKEIAIGSMAGDDFNDMFVVSGVRTDTYAQGEGMVYYKGFLSVKAKFTYSVNDWVLSAVIYKSPTKFEYHKDDEINLEGGIINLFFRSAATKAVQYTMQEAVEQNLIKISGFTTLEAGPVDVSVCRVPGGEVLSTFSVNVENRLAGISIYKKPTKQTYYIGEEMDWSGCQVKLLYDFSEDNQIISASSSLLTTEYHFFAVGSRTVYVRYALDTSFEASFQVTVSARKASGITLIQNPKAEFYIGEIPSYTSGVLLVSFTEGENAEIALWDKEYLSLTKGITITGLDTSSLTTGTRTATITYDSDGDGIADAQTTYEYSVIRNLLGINIVNKPTKLEYRLGDALSLNGLKVELSYADAMPTSEVETDDLTIGGFDATLSGTQKVYVGYGVYVASFDVKVVAPVPVSIKVAEASDLDANGKNYADYGFTGPKTAFNWGDDFTSIGLVVLVTYDYSYGDIVSPAFVKLPNDDFMVVSSAYSATSADNAAHTYSIAVIELNEGINSSYSVSRGERTKSIGKFVVSGSSSHSTLVTLSDAAAYDASRLIMAAEYYWDDSGEYAGFVDLVYGEDYTVNATAITNATSTGKYNLVVNILIAGFTSVSQAYSVTISDAGVKTLGWLTAPTSAVNAWYGYSDLTGTLLDNGLVLYGYDVSDKVRVEYNYMTASQFDSNFETLAKPSNIGKIITVTIEYGSAAIQLPIKLNDSPDMAWNAAPSAAVGVITKYSDFETWLYDINVINSTIVLDMGTFTREYGITSSIFGNNWSDFTSSDGATPLKITCGNSYVELDVALAQRTIQSLNIYSSPTKTTYNIGEALDLTGGYLYAFYNDGKGEKISMKATGVTVSAIGDENITKFASAGVFAVNVTYGGITTNIYITVEQDVISDIALDTKNAKLTFAAEEVFTADGLKVTYKKKSTGSTLQTAELNTDYIIDASAFNMISEGEATIVVNGIGILDGTTLTYKVTRTSTLNPVGLRSVNFKFGSTILSAVPNGNGEYVVETRLGGGIYEIEMSTEVVDATATAYVNTSETTAVNFDGISSINIVVKVTKGTQTASYNVILNAYVDPINSLTIGGESQDSSFGYINYTYDSASPAVTISLSIKAGYVAYIDGVEATSLSVNASAEGSHIVVGKMSAGGVFEEAKRIIINYTASPVIKSLKLDGVGVAYVSGGYQTVLSSVKSSMEIATTLASGYSLQITKNGVEVEGGTLTLNLGDNEFLLTAYKGDYFEEYTLNISVPIALVFNSVGIGTSTPVYNPENEKYEDVSFGDIKFTYFDGNVIGILGSNNGTTVNIIVHHNIVLNDGWELVSIGDENGVFDGAKLTSEDGSILTSLHEGVNYITIKASNSGTTATLVLPIEYTENAEYYGSLADSVSITVCGQEVEGDRASGYYVRLPVGYPASGIRVSDVQVSINAMAAGSEYYSLSTVENSGENITVRIYKNGKPESLCVIGIKVVRVEDYAEDLDVIVVGFDRNDQVTFALDGSVYKATIEVDMGTTRVVKFVHDKFVNLSFGANLNDIIDVSGKIITDSETESTVQFTATGLTSSRTYALTIKVVKKTLLNIGLYGSDGTEDELTHYANSDSIQSTCFVSDGTKILGFFSTGEYINTYGFTSLGTNNGKINIKFNASGYGTGAKVYAGVYSAQTHSSSTLLSQGQFVELAVTKSDGVWKGSFYVYVGGCAYQYELNFYNAIIGVTDDVNNGELYFEPTLSGVTSAFEYDSQSGEFVYNCTFENAPIIFNEQSETITYYVFAFVGSKVYFNSTNTSGTACSDVEEGVYTFGTSLYEYNGALTGISDDTATVVFTVKGNDGVNRVFRINIAA